MLILATTAQPDYVALAMVLVLAVIVAVMALRKRFGKKPVEEPVQVVAQPEPQVTPATPPGSAGQLKLHDVPPKTAAMLMAIVAHKMDKPLNELGFISIKEVK